jgi:hypothetical protein
MNYCRPYFEKHRDGAFLLVVSFFGRALVRSRAGASNSSLLWGHYMRRIAETRAWLGPQKDQRVTIVPSLRLPWQYSKVRFLKGRIKYIIFYL